MVSHEYFSAQVRGFFILIIPKDEGFHFIDFKLLTADNFGGVLLKLKRTRNEAIRLYCRIGFCFFDGYHHYQSRRGDVAFKQSSQGLS